MVCSVSRADVRTPLEFSPYVLIQEKLRHQPWRLLIAVMMLNQTSAVQVKPILDGFFERWPDPGSLFLADEEEVAEYVKPLGLQNRRARAMIRMSGDFMAEESIADASILYGIGKYGADSYRMFVVGELVDDVKDKELKKYLEWAKGRAQTHS